MKSKSVKRRLKEIPADKLLFDMVYHWGQVGTVACFKSLPYQTYLAQCVEEKYKAELKIADDRWKRAEEKLRDYEEA